MPSPRVSKSRPEPIRVLLVDDHPLMREGIRGVLDQQPDMVVCAEAATAAEALEQIERESPQVVVADLTLSGGSGLDLIRDLRARFPRVRVLAFSMHDERVFAERALRAGARGYVMKQEPPERLVEGIRHILQGVLFLSPEVSNGLLDTFVSGDARRDRMGIHRLSDREVQVFEAIGRGGSTREIAEQLSLSTKTVETYRTHIKRKLGLNRNNSLIHAAIHWVEESQAPSPGTPGMTDDG